MYAQGLLQQLLQGQQQQLQEQQKLRDLVQVLMLSQGNLTTLAHGHLALQLQMFQAQMQGGGCVDSQHLPVKRSLLDMEAASQPASKNEMRRAKFQRRYEKELQHQQTAAQQKQLQQLAQHADANAALSGRLDDMEFALPGDTAQDLVQPPVPQSSHGAGATRSPTAGQDANRLDIPGDGRGMAWQQWFGLCKVLAGKGCCCSVCQGAVKQMVTLLTCFKMM